MNARAHQRVARKDGLLEVVLTDSQGRAHYCVGSSISEIVKQGREAGILLVSPSHQTLLPSDYVPALPGTGK